MKAWNNAYNSKEICNFPNGCLFNCRVCIHDDKETFKILIKKANSKWYIFKKMIKKMMKK